MPYYSNYSRRYRPRFRRRFRKRRGLGPARTNTISRVRLAQAQGMNKMWFKQVGPIQANQVGRINDQFDGLGLITIDQFITACGLYEQYKIVKMILTVYSAGDISRGIDNIYHRGNISSFIDVPPISNPPVQNMAEVMNNNSFRLHPSNAFKFKRYIYRPAGYPQWTLIDRLQNPPFTPVPNVDTWTSRICILGDNFGSNTAPNVPTQYYWYTMKYCVVFKSRADA